MSKVKDICKADNRLQRKLIHGEISKAEFDFRKTKIHKEYIAITNEEKLLNDLIRKHGGI